MRCPVPTAMLAAGLLLVAMLPSLAALPRATNELGDDWAVISASSFSVATLHVGDQNVGLTITLRNLRPADADAANGDERMYCVTAEVYGVRDRDGRPRRRPGPLRGGGPPAGHGALQRHVRREQRPRRRRAEGRGEAGRVRAGALLPDGRCPLARRTRLRGLIARRHIQFRPVPPRRRLGPAQVRLAHAARQIGRASCRERV